VDLAPLGVGEIVRPLHREVQPALVERPVQGLCWQAEDTPTTDNA